MGIPSSQAAPRPVHQAVRVVAPTSVRTPGQLADPWSPAVARVSVTAQGMSVPLPDVMAGRQHTDAARISGGPDRIQEMDAHGDEHPHGPAPGLTTIDWRRDRRWSAWPRLPPAAVVGGAGGEPAHRQRVGVRSPLAGVEALLAHRDNPAAAWDSPMPARRLLLVDHRRHRRRLVVAIARGRRGSIRGGTRTRRKVAGDGRPARDGDDRATSAAPSGRNGCWPSASELRPTLTGRAAPDGSGVVVGHGPRRRRVDQRPRLGRAARPVRRRQRRVRGEQPRPGRARRGRRHLHPPRRPVASP